MTPPPAHRPQSAPLQAPLVPQASHRLRVRPKPIAMRVSVVVPCAAKHVAVLPELLRHLALQTSPPDEVVLSVSGCDALAKAATAYPGLDVKVTLLTAPAFAGANRNRGCDASVGQVIVFQDADDLPHPQRIEILRRMFERCEVDHVMHTFSRHKVDPQRFDVDAALRLAFYRFPYAKDAKLTNGNIAVSRTAAKAMRFNERMARGQDSAFNQAICPLFRQTTVLLKLPLILYRQNLSTYRR